LKGPEGRRCQGGKGEEEYKTSPPTYLCTILTKKGAKRERRGVHRNVDFREDVDEYRTRSIDICAQKKGGTAFALERPSGRGKSVSDETSGTGGEGRHKEKKEGKRKVGE